MIYKSKAGFTLLELSIVIVIIGLIVAGISAGQSLVNQAQFRQLFSDISKYELAHNTFRLQYDAIAGDMDNANSYWSGCNSSATAAECNGNGDGQVTPSTSLTDNEELRYWQHMALAEILDGTFSGTSASTGSSHVDHFRGVNAPATIYSGCIAMFYRTPNAWTGGNSLHFGRGEGDPSSGACNDNIFTGREVYNIETKFGDDLLARSGRIFVGGNCYTAGAYELNTEDTCNFEISIE